MKDYINLLHVGAGCGATLLALKQRYPNVYVYGVENNSHAARLSNQVAPTVQSEYEHLQDIYPKKKFDIVLLTAPIPKVKLNLLVNSIESILTSNGIMMLSQENSQNYTELQ
ncbi:glycosyl transferase, partial [Bacillus anthracis]